ncbi:MAG: hypothetical protein IKF39_04580, partial [Oscillospiraceae bacterium]|nr:hypothetical protein [Oscillospiraceae bacterium]
MDDNKVTITTTEYAHLIKTAQKYDWLKAAIYKAASFRDGKFEYISSSALERALEIIEPVLIQMLNG